MRRSRVRDIVYKTLEEDTRAREDDNYLIYKTVKELFPRLTETYFKTALQTLTKVGISFESITRHRRKFLELHPELKPKQTTKIRKEEEKNYEKEYGSHLPRLD